LFAMLYNNGFEMLVMLTLIYVPVMMVYSKLEELSQIETI